MIKVSKGLDIPISGTSSWEGPESLSDYAPKHVAVLGDDFLGMKPTMAVKVGDSVKVGSLLFTDKKLPSVRYTSPGSGKVVAINRGERRVFESVVVELSDEQTHETFSAYKQGGEYSREDLIKLLLESGEWTAIIERPFGKVANPDAKASSLFINTMDTNALSLDPMHVINMHKDEFEAGVNALKVLAGKTFVCHAPGADLPQCSGVTYEAFKGPHPAGNSGTHVHYLDPVDRSKVVWQIQASDVIAIGNLVKTGQVWTKRYFALCGPAARHPRHCSTTRGADLAPMIKESFHAPKDTRVVSGPILAGRKADGGKAFLGRAHTQVVILEEGTNREFLGWHAPGLNKFSFKSVFLSKLLPNKKFAMSTDSNGSLRSMVPIGSFEGVMPIDIVPTFLLRSLLANDYERAMELGCLELLEEDLALCTFVDPCKIDYAPALRRNLTTIEKEA